MATMRTCETCENFKLKGISKNEERITFEVKHWHDNPGPYKPNFRVLLDNMIVYHATDERDMYLFAAQLKANIGKGE
jgi:hypothetical protein